jgi:hypothetical protein
MGGEVGWDWDHMVRRPLFGLLYQPLVIDDDECGAVGGMIMLLKCTLENYVAGTDWIYLA